MKRFFGLALAFAGISAMAVPMLAYIPRTVRMMSSGDIVATRWDAGELPIVWTPDLGSVGNVSGGRTIHEVFESSFANWADASLGNLFVEGTEAPEELTPIMDQVNVITTDLTPAEWIEFGSSSQALSITQNYWSFDSGANAVTIVESDIAFNPNSHFRTDLDVPTNGIDLESVATHEIGHLLGLDHSNLISSTMFPRIGVGASNQRSPEIDDRVGAHVLYPGTFSGTGLGRITGTVRTMADVGLFGALVVAVDQEGRATVSGMTDPTGTFSILAPAGTYTIYAEPMTDPFFPFNAGSLVDSYPELTVDTDFTVRFR